MRFVQPEKIEIDANERAVNEKSQYCFFVCTTFDSFLNDLINSPMSSIPLPTTTKNGRVARLVVIHFYYTEFTPKCLTSNPLSQIVTSNPRLQPDIHFAVDMFPYKKTELSQKSGFKSKPPKKPGNTPLSGTYLSFLDIKTTVSTCIVTNIGTYIFYLVCDMGTHFFRFFYCF